MSSIYRITLNENHNVTYPTFVRNLFKREGFPPLMHAAVGISGEAGELIDAIKKHIIYGKELDVENVKEELGDLYFYMQAMINELHLSWDEIIQGNGEKLKKRYPAGEYSNSDAIARADKIETVSVNSRWVVAKSKEDYLAGLYFAGPFDRHSDAMAHSIAPTDYVGEVYAS